MHIHYHLYYFPVTAAFSISSKSSPHLGITETEHIVNELTEDNKRDRQKKKESSPIKYRQISGLFRKRRGSGRAGG